MAAVTLKKSQILRAEAIRSRPTISRIVQLTANRNYYHSLSGMSSEHFLMLVMRLHLVSEHGHGDGGRDQLQIRFPERILSSASNDTRYVTKQGVGQCEEMFECYDLMKRNRNNLQCTESHVLLILTPTIFKHIITTGRYTIKIHGL